VILSHTAVSSRSVTTGSRASTTTVKHVGRNHVWIPSLGISRSVRPGPPQQKPSMTLQTCVGSTGQDRLMVRLVATH
jgi:hypothetical protein